MDSLKQLKIYQTVYSLSKVYVKEELMLFFLIFGNIGKQKAVL